MSSEGGDEDAADNAFCITQPTIVEEEQQQQQKWYLPSVDLTVVIRQIPSQGLSFQIWEAAKVLVTLLDQFHLQPTQSPLPHVFNPPRPLNILELGSGTGLVGIAAAAVLGARVTLTDLPHVLPNLAFNAEANSSAVSSSGGAVDVKALSWGEDGVAGDFDIVLGSDLVYHQNLYDPLLNTLSSLLYNPKVLFLMAHSRRWKKESAFFNKARKMFRVEIIYSSPPPPGARIGILVYSFARRLSDSSISIPIINKTHF